MWKVIVAFIIFFLCGVLIIQNYNNDDSIFYTLKGTDKTIITYKSINKINLIK